MFDKELLKGKVALVVGGSTGTGPEIARAFAEVSADVAVTYHEHADEADAVVRTIEGKGLKSKAYQFDLLDGQAVRTLPKQVADDLGRLDILVLCAGAGGFGDVKELDEETWDWAMNGNVRASFFLARNAALVMETGDGGRIVTFSATSALKYGHAFYGLSKAAVIQMTRFLAHTFAPKVTVNCLIPGLIDLEEAEANLRTERAKNSPLQRIVAPRELAQLCVMMCSPAFDSVTGESLIADAGFWLKHF